MQDQVDVVTLGAWLSIGLLVVTLAAFIAQLISKYGIGRVLRISTEVKLYLAIAATAMCGLTAARATARGTRLRWLTAAMVCAASVYFSTSRGFIAVAVIGGLAAFGLSRKDLDFRSIAKVGLATGLVIFALFVGLGQVLGKTYENSSIGQFDNFFSRHSAVSSLALPYQDLTASIPALDLLVKASPTWGVTHGCATAPIACGALRKVGVHTLRVPVAGPFTKAPLQWNAYTFLDRFLIDAGPALTLLLVAMTGLFAGYWWARARADSAVCLIVYAIGLPALVAAYRQNLIELLGIAAVIAVCLFLLAKPLSRFRLALRRSPAQGVT
jgi:hypothetical protein